MHFYELNGLKLRLYNRGLLAVLIACTALLSHKAEAQYRLFNWGYNTWNSGNVPLSQLGTLPIIWSANSLYGRGVPGQIRALSNVTSLAIGDYHILALKSDGTVWAWGDNTYGQLGNGTYTVGSDKPVQVGGLTNVIAIAAGGYHSIALKSDGTVWVWGANFFGVLGNGTHDSLPHPVPRQVTAFVTPVTAIAAGELHMMALDANGAVWLWGYNLDGQIGNGTTTEQDGPARLNGFVGVSIAAGGNNSMARKPDGTIWVWGNIDTLNPTVTPTVVPGLTSVSAMNTNNAGTFVIKGDGTLWNINTLSGLSANQVPYISNVASVSSCANFSNITVALKNGTVWSVGENTYGQVGNATTTNVNQWNWMQAVGVSNIGQALAGYQHTLSLKSDGTVWSWGDNTYGQLAAASSLEQDVPARNRLVLGSMTSAAIGSDSSGYAFFLMVKKNGDVWSWGSNSNGQFGDGSTTDNYIAPVQTYQFGNASQVAASRNASSYAIKMDSTLWAWGNNAYGQLGDGTANDHHQPFQVAGFAGNIKAIAPGSFHAVALRNDGTVWAWGGNSSGQLGDGTTTQRLVPVQVSGLTNVTAIAAGNTFSLALKNDGTVWAWGYNGSGQLGNGTTTQQNSPIQVSGLSNIVAIAAGYEHALALKNDGTVWAWGTNSEGELGNGTTSNSSIPQQVPGLTNVKTISASGTSNSGQSFAIKKDGSTWDWGNDYNGQLGDGINTNGGKQLTPVQVHLPGISRILGNGTATLALVKDPDPDFNADNYTDLLWQNKQTGEHSVWYMNTTTWPGPADFLHSAIPTSWTLTGTTDFNGDGQSDLLWQNTLTGDVSLWYMNGATYTGSASYVARGVPLQWKIVGVADLSGDGSPDLIWQNQSTGDVAYWIMNGSNAVSSGYIAYGIPLQWKIVGTADMDGDGSPDLIWQNASAGDVVVWYLKGGTWTNNWDYLARGIPSSWHVASIQDLVGNNQPQLLWQSDAGQIVWWDMDVATGWTGNWSYIYQGLPASWTLTRAH